MCAIIRWKKFHWGALFMSLDYHHQADIHFHGRELFQPSKSSWLMANSTSRRLASFSSTEAICPGKIILSSIFPTCKVRQHRNFQPLRGSFLYTDNRINAYAAITPHAAAQGEYSLQILAKDVQEGKRVYPLFGLLRTQFWFRSIRWLY